MANGVPPVPAPAASPPAAAGSHGSHGGPVAGAAPSAFAAALSQALAQPAAAAAHGSHGGGAGGGLNPGIAGQALRPAGHGAAAGGTDPRHIPLAGQTHAGAHGFQETVLGLRAYRLQLIASNIANADTPHYKAVDIDFQEALRLALSQLPPLQLATTSAAHVGGQAQGSAPPLPLKYVVPSQASIDGNTVDMDMERAKFAENAMMYEFSLDRVSGHYKHLMELLKELK